MFGEIEAAILQRFIGFVQAGEGVASEADFMDWCCTHLKPIIPFERMIWSVGERRGGELSIHAICGIGYPTLFIAQLGATRHSIYDRKLIMEWLKTRRPQVINSKTAPLALSTIEMKEYEEFKMENIWAHGVIDATGNRASYFSFAVPSDTSRNEQSIKTLLTLVAPHLHEGAKRVQMTSASASDRTAIPDFLLSEKEREVLFWLVAGKTNEEISLISSRSVYTIKNQVKSILDKLGAQNRTHASRLAVQHGLIAALSENSSKELL